MEIELVPKDVSFMHCSVRVSRNYFPIVVRVFFIIFFIIAMTTFVFAFPTEILGDRLAYTLTQFLTITAFLFVLTQQLPTLPYRKSPFVASCCKLLQVAKLSRLGKNQDRSLSVGILLPSAK